MSEKYTKENAEKTVLGHLWDLCYRAHSNISFSPEKRASQYVIDYSEELEKDLEKLGENQGNYKEKYIQKFSAWMNAKSNCISSMITGPANFPVRRAEKANASEMNRMNEFFSWREKYFKAVNRKPTPSPEEELESAMKNLDSLRILQELMKDANKIIRKHTKKGILDIEGARKELIENEFTEKTVSRLLTKDNIHGYGFPRYSLTNNNATIKRTEEKILIMKNRIHRKKTFEDIVFDGGRVTLEDDRFKIFHDEKPERAIIDELKSNGFRWSPHWSCWCRKHTGNALYVIQRLSFIKV